MAESVDLETQVAGQHYLVCGSQNCKKSCQFYCNFCHREMCKECRDEHLKSPDTKNHEVVLYRQRKYQLPREKCKVHPHKDIEILCNDCNIPICLKCCTLQEHSRHKLVDLEEIYSDNCGHCQVNIRQIYQYFLPTCEELSQETEADVIEVKKIMDGIRTSIRAESEHLKRLVETTKSEKTEHVDEVEKSLMEMLQGQKKTYKDYISYLNDLVKEFHGYLSSTQLTDNPMISVNSGSLNIKPIPETTKPVPPKFTAVQLNKNDIDNLLGSMNIPNSKPEARAIKSMETVPLQFKQTEQQMQKEKDKNDENQTLPLSSLISKIEQCTVPGVVKACHRSIDKSGKFWVSDQSGNLVQIDPKANLLQQIKTSGRKEGYHSVTQDGDLIYADKNKNVINRVTMDRKITEFIKTGDWTPLSIHSSRINGDILVGMIKDGKAKVTRYNKTGKEIQSIQRDNKGVELYCYPHFITENINGDICTSDDSKYAVIVVNKAGECRFSYSEQEPHFYPSGICTDHLGHIIICNARYANEKVNILDKDGCSLGCLLTPQQWLGYPCGVCVDEENNLYVGEYKTNLVKVYQNLQ